MNIEKEFGYMKTLFKIMVYPIIILLWAVIKLGFTYENWVKKFGAKQIAKSIIFFKKYNYENYEAFVKGIADKQARYKEMSNFKRKS
jgi:hypothetical protein